jgi:hypothetical protein
MLVTLPAKDASALIDKNDYNIVIDDVHSIQSISFSASGV